MRTTRRRLLGALAGAAAAGTAGYAGTGATGERERSAEQLQDGPYAEVYRETIDSVVLVRTGPGGGGSGGMGTGFVYDEDHLVTNYHVVGEAEGVEVQFGEADWRSADVVGTDPHGDLAALAVDDRPEYATPLSLSEDDPAVGTEVLALGNPFGFDASISRGIVSGVDRLLPSPSGFSIPAAIQTDASVNPGNSGGPLVDLEGAVAGVVFAGAGQTIGFAISPRLSGRVVPELIADGAYEHPYLGVGLAPVSPLIADANDVEARGVLVGRVAPGSPADGVLRPADERTLVDGVPVPVGGDVIVELDGEDVPTQESLTSYLALETSPGDAVELAVVRDGETETVELELAARPDDPLPRDDPGGRSRPPGGRPTIDSSAGRSG